MCFGSTPKPSIPEPQPLPPAPAPPPAPKTPAPAPKPLQSEKAQNVRMKSSARQRSAVSRGTSSLRIPLNTGGSNSGGLNL